MGFFNRKSKQAKGKHVEVTNGTPSPPVRARWQSTWTSSEVAVDEIEELVHTVTAEMKLRAEALDSPFLLLPFRPSVDPTSARTFINNFFKSNASGSQQYRGNNLQRELRLTDQTVLCSILKWCWSRMSKGVVSWPVYEAFRLGEKEANMARNAFDTFIPLGSDSPARTNIIIDFFELLAAIAAHGKLNGLGGRKLSRLAGWWAFEHTDGGKGFEGGYKSWASAADASSHLFFGYLRSLSPDVNPSMNVIERIPRSLQALLAQTEYPPQTPALLQRTTPRVVMIVDQVSPTPFSLLRRAKHFEYRQNDRVLREYSEFDDPVSALTDECKRVLYAIASINSSGSASTGQDIVKSDETWTSFTSVGFGDLGATNGNGPTPTPKGNPSVANTGVDRPTTPSWGDFLSSGFYNEVSKSPSTMLLPPDKVLPPIQSRTQTPSIRSGTDYEEDLTPGELAAITSVELDDAFWWVWMTSLAGEEPNERKAVFGRCALIETSISNGQWLIMEEQVKGATPDPLEGAQIVEKKSRFSFSRRNRIGRGKSSSKKSTTPSVPEVPSKDHDTKANRMTISLEKQAKIKEAAADLARRNDNPSSYSNARRAGQEDSAGHKNQSSLAIGLQSEAGPAMKWANTYDKDTIRSAYLGSNLAGTGQSLSTDNLTQDNKTDSAYLGDFAAVQAQRTLDVQTPEPKAQSSHTKQASYDLAAPSDAYVSAKQSIETAPKADAAHVERYDPLEKELGPSADTHPALRQQEPEQRPASPEPETNPAILAAKLALEGRAVSPESVNSSRLKKQQGTAGGSGIRKFFSRGKDKSNRRSMEVHNKQVTSVGAAGAASAASDAAMARKLPVVRGQPTSPIQEQSPVAEQDVTQEHDSYPTSNHGHYNDSNTALSKVDSQDQREADAAFSRFDQGPMTDMPATAPQDSDDDHLSDAVDAPAVAHYSPEAPTTTNEPVAHYAPATPVTSQQAPATREPTSPSDAQSETTMDDHNKATASSPTTAAAGDSSKDRWERIRENAARRAANARASEDTSTRSRLTDSRKTDDGETSGEETIESRVARIKARVAELTSNMDSTASPALRR